MRRATAKVDAAFPLLGLGGALRAASVGPVTAARYRAGHAELVAFAAERGLPLNVPDEADRALAYLFDALVQQGDLAHEGVFVPYGAAWVRGWPTRGASFPLAKQALKGWRRVFPGVPRDPLPWAAAVLSARALLNSLLPDAAVAAAAIVIGFDLYLRPSETLRITRGAVTHGAPGSKARHVLVINTAPLPSGCPPRSASLTTP